MLVSSFKSEISSNVIKIALIELFLIQENNLNPDTWFKYAEIMSKQYNSNNIIILTYTINLIQFIDFEKKINKLKKRQI